ncbi:Peptidyl-prolyl cis-trans isomerase FKBP65, partial [Bienertia sinuspersici]
GNKTTINLLVGGLAGNRIRPPPLVAGGSPIHSLPERSRPADHRRAGGVEVICGFLPTLALSKKPERGERFLCSGKLFRAVGILWQEVARNSFSQLATSLILNMAASLLKKKEFEHVGHLCSIVLNYNPNNVKALFRRANATIGSSEYELACWDLRVVLEVEPSNQEVVKKLKEVEQILRSPPKQSNGQAKEQQEECGPKVPINDSMENEKDSNQDEREDFICNDFDFCKMMEVDKRDERAIVKDIECTEGNPKTKEVELSKKENGEEVGVIGMARKKKVGRSKLHFQNKRKPKSGLALSRSDYQILPKGRTIQHFNPRIGIVMSIKVIGTSQDTSNKLSENHTQQFPHSPPKQQGELPQHKVVADSVTHAVAKQSETCLLKEISSSRPEKVDMDQQIEVASMLTDSPPYATPFDRSPICLQSSATDNRSLSFQSTTTGNPSLSRRTRNQGMRNDATRARRINHRNPTCVITNHGFQCRLKIEARFKHDDYLPPNSQNHSSY